MKECTKCKLDKSLDDFAWKNKSKGVKNTWCRVCIKKYDRLRQESKAYLDRKYSLAKARQTIAKYYILNILEKSCCTDCGNENPVVLQFDHRNPDNKSYNVSQMLDFSTETIQKEIDKCDIRCANCHAIRTAKQFGYWKTLQ
jgi:hypothetical protein